MDSKRLVAAILAIFVVSATLIYGNLAGVGIWEPWEANPIIVAQEYASRGPAPEITDPKQTSYNWAVPTLADKPVSQSLLKTWLISARVQPEVIVGEFEFDVRSLIAHSLILFVLLGLFTGVRRFTDLKTAALSAVIFVSMPAIYLGVHNLSTEMLAVLSTSLALGGLFIGAQLPQNRVFAGILFGVGLTLAFLDQRLMGIDFVLLIAAAWALTELPFTDDPQPIGRPEVIGSVVALVVGLAALAWALSEQTDRGYLPHRLQIAAAVLPIMAAVAGLVLARKTIVGRAMSSVPFLVATAVTAGVAVFVAHTYGEANPTLLENGVVLGKVPSLTFLLENEVFGKSLANKHMTFEILVRQVGFSLVPWVALAPVAIAYCARASSASAEGDDVQGRRLRRFLLVWAVFGACITSAGSMYGHYFFIAYVPIAIATALFLTDAAFWKRVRMQPLLAYGMGFTAICITMMLFKDIERFPTRFIEVYTAYEPKFELPEGFGFGKSLKAFKYGFMGLLAVYFFGLISTALVWFRGARELPERFNRWKESRGTDAAVAFWDPLDTESPILDRAAQKEAIRQEDGIQKELIKSLELPERYAVILTACFVAFSGLVLFKWMPEVSNHTSQRGVFETFQADAKDGEPLMRYDVLGRDNSVYLGDIKTIKNTREFLNKLQEDKRFFAIIPRKNLARINYEVRREIAKNLPVLDARSSRLLLVSNKPTEGRDDQNFIAESIIEDESVIQNKIEFKTKDGMQHPVFDGQLEMVGISYDKPAGKDGVPEYKWDETAVIDYYFRVKKRVPNNQKIFVHVDYPGNRINGDHYPNDGNFPTNYWLPGDLVRSRHHLKIPNYSTPGVYTLNFGFFVGSKRMAVTPRKAHDGGNRVKVGKIKVTSL